MFRAVELTVLTCNMFFKNRFWGGTTGMTGYESESPIERTKLRRKKATTQLLWKQKTGLICENGSKRPVLGETKKHELWKQKAGFREKRKQKTGFGRNEETGVMKANGRFWEKRRNRSFSYESKGPVLELAHCFTKLLKCFLPSPCFVKRSKKRSIFK